MGHLAATLETSWCGRCEERNGSSVQRFSERGKKHNLVALSQTQQEAILKWDLKYSRLCHSAQQPLHSASWHFHLKWSSPQRGGSHDQAGLAKGPCLCLGCSQDGRIHVLGHQDHVARGWKQAAGAASLRQGRLWPDSNKHLHHFGAYLGWCKIDLVDTFLRSVIDNNIIYQWKGQVLTFELSVQA